MDRKEPPPFFNIILDSIANGVFTINDLNEITSFNRAAEEITGFKREEAIGQRCFDIFRTNICQTSCALQKTIKTGKKIINFSVNILNKEGKEIPVSISTTVLKNDEGKVIGGVETFQDLSVVEELKKEITQQYSLEDIISKNHTIQKIFGILPDIAESDATVLIQGPSGSGKELFARAIHNLSRVKKGPYIKVSCGALPDTLLESELFGYLRGAFTDARKDKKGRFALAEGGTIFLDEIGDVSPALQVKLLRVLQEKEYEPLGSTETLKARVRVVAATNKNLLKLVNEGSFREDLFYRLNVLKIELPPLSLRREDIPLLVKNFIHKLNLKNDRNILGTSDSVMKFLMGYEFPGNIRELENIIEHAFVLCKEEIIGMENLPSGIVPEFESAAHSRLALIHPLKSAEARLIQKTLERNKGSRTVTARELDIDRTTLWRKIKKYGL